MKVSRIKISNILGIESLEVEAGKFVAFTGANGTGKTSALEAVKAAISGGHDATLLRAGATEGEVVLVLDDGATISKRVTQDKTSQAMRDPSGVCVSSPATKIKSLIDALSVNPLEFIFAKPDRRMSVLLESMPLKADPERIKAISGGSAPIFDGHALHVIEATRKAVYDERTATNAAAKSKRATIVQLANAIPDSHVTDGESEEEIIAELDDIEIERATECKRITDKINTITATIKSEIEELRAEIAKKTALLSEQQAKAEAAINSCGMKNHTKKTEAKARLDAIRKNRDNITRAKQTKETISKMEEEAKELESISEAQTKILQSLNDYKGELLSSLPIQGLEIVGTEIIFNGVPFDRVNTAEQYRIAIEIAKLRSGKLGLICVDGVEALDEKSYAEFKAASIASGLQMVVTRVSDHEFAVEVDQ